jgi:hypothetical protein
VLPLRPQGPLARATKHHSEEKDWFAMIPAAAIFDSELTDAAFRAYAAAAAFAGRDRIVRQSQGTIAKLMRSARQSVNKWWGQAQRRGWLKMEQQTSKPGGGRGFNVYRLAGFERRLEDQKAITGAQVEGAGHSPSREPELRVSDSRSENESGETVEFHRVNEAGTP